MLFCGLPYTPGLLSTTQLYQRSLALVLYVGDSAKRKRRLGADNQTIMRQLRQLARPEMRLRLQDLFFDLHVRQQRALTWAEVESEMLRDLQSARNPMLPARLKAG